MQVSSLNMPDGSDKLLVAPTKPVVAERASTWTYSKYITYITLYTREEKLQVIKTCNDKRSIPL